MDELILNFKNESDELITELEDLLDDIEEDFTKKEKHVFSFNFKLNARSCNRKKIWNNPKFFN